jgi:hypothetical protein
MGDEGWMIDEELMADEGMDLPAWGPLAFATSAQLSLAVQPQLLLRLGTSCTPPQGTATSLRSI